jgi:hypothetical protein
MSDDLIKRLRDRTFLTGSLEGLAADRIEQLERERDELRGFDDYFRSLCGFKRDGRNSKECLDAFISGLKKQDVIVPFDHFLKVAEEQNTAQAKLAKAVDAIKEIKAAVALSKVPIAWLIRHQCKVVLAELEGGE